MKASWFVFVVLEDLISLRLWEGSLRNAPTTQGRADFDGMFMTVTVTAFQHKDRS